MDNLEFIKSVIQRAQSQRSKITFYCGNNAVTVEHDSSTQYLKFKSDEDCILFRIAFPGENALSYIAGRVREVFDKKKRVVEEGEPICC